MPVASSLETVLFRQHVRMGRGVQQRAGPRLRLNVELACGAAALLSTVSLAALHARYVAAPEQQGPDPAGRDGWIGGTLTFFAVGCPVCNKLVLLALGSAGAMTWFEPVQPLLQLVAVALLAWALQRRLAGERSCATPTNVPATTVRSDPS